MLLLLFRNRPALAPELLREALQVALPSYSEVRLTECLKWRGGVYDHRGSEIQRRERPQAEAPKAPYFGIHTRSQWDARWSERVTG
jgi:hypothetical protein